MKQIMRWLGKGMLGVLPAIVTLYAIYWLLSLLEGVLATPLQWLLGEAWYVPGMGLGLAIGLLIAVGILIDAYVGRWLVDVMEAIVDRVPVVKSIYGAVRDFLQFALGQRQQDISRVVAWECRPDTWIVGFVTGPAFFRTRAGAVQDTGEGGMAKSDPDLDDRRSAPTSGHEDSGAHVSVYFPMSYQIGGYTLVLPERDLITLEMGVEQAMKSVLSAGVVRSGDRDRDRHAPPDVPQ